MSNSEFEKNVRDELNDLSFEPTGAVWNRVEAQLPEKDRRRWLLLIIPFLLGAGIFINYYNNNTTNKPAAETQSAAKKSEAVEKAAKKNSFPPTEETKKVTSLISAKPHRVDGSGDSQLKQVGHLVSSSKKTTPNVNAQLGPKNTSRSNSPLTIPGKTSVVISSAVPEEDVASKTNNTSPPASTELKVEGTDLNSNEIDSSIAILSKPLTVGLKESLDTIVKVASKDENNKLKRGWTAAITLGAGVSNIKSGLFNNNHTYTDVLSSSPPSIPTSPSPLPSQPGKPSPSFAWTAGISFEKNISKSITFQTGINYAYLSNHINVGTRVDSAGTFTTVYGNAYVNSYYQTGSSENYNNRLHLLSLPMLIQFKPWLRLPVYAEAGLTPSFLLRSNMLQYSSSRDAYYNYEKSNKKMLLGMQAGLGVHLKSFKMGYRLNYSLSSVTKNTSAQYPVTSIFYLQLPIKKF